MSFYRLPTLVFVAALFSCLSVPVLAQKSDADKATGTSAQSVQKPDTDKQETPNDKDDKEKEKEKAKKSPAN